MRWSAGKAFIVITLSNFLQDQQGFLILVTWLLFLILSLHTVGSKSLSTIDFNLSET